MKGIAIEVEARFWRYQLDGLRALHQSAALQTRHDKCSLGVDIGIDLMGWQASAGSELKALIEARRRQPERLSGTGLHSGRPETNMVPLSKRRPNR